MGTIKDKNGTDLVDAKEIKQEEMETIHGRAV